MLSHRAEASDGKHCRKRGRAGRRRTPALTTGQRTCNGWETCSDGRQPTAGTARKHHREMQESAFVRPRAPWKTFFGLRATARTDPLEYGRRGNCANDGRLLNPSPRCGRTKAFFCISQTDLSHEGDFLQPERDRARQRDAGTDGRAANLGQRGLGTGGESGPRERRTRRGKRVRGGSYSSAPSARRASMRSASTSPSSWPAARIIAGKRE